MKLPGAERGRIAIGLQTPSTTCRASLLRRVSWGVIIFLAK